jgi:hypothetical protein
MSIRKIKFNANTWGLHLVNSDLYLYPNQNYRHIIKHLFIEQNNTILNQWYINQINYTITTDNLKKQPVVFKLSTDKYEQFDEIRKIEKQTVKQITDSFLKIGSGKITSYSNIREKINNIRIDKITINNDIKYLYESEKEYNDNTPTLITKPFYIDMEKIQSINIIRKKNSNGDSYEDDSNTDESNIKTISNKEKMIRKFTKIYNLYKSDKLIKINICRELKNIHCVFNTNNNELYFNFNYTCKSMCVY